MYLVTTSMISGKAVKYYWDGVNFVRGAKNAVAVANAAETIASMDACDAYKARIRVQLSVSLR